MEECLSVNDNLGVCLHDALISSSEDPEDSEVGYALRVVEDRLRHFRCAASGHSECRCAALCPACVCQLFDLVAYLSVVDAVVALDIHCHIGSADGGVAAVAAAEDIEVRVLVVGVRILPLLRCQQFVGRHALQHLHRSLSRAFLQIAVGGVCAYGANVLATTIYIMWVEELAVVEECRLIHVPSL